MPRPAPAPPPFLPRLLGVALLAAALVACGGTSATPTPAPTPAAPTEVPGGDGRTPGPVPGTIETTWGTAWEELPPGFPLPAGVTPAGPGDPADEPASGAFVVERAVDPVAEEARARLAGAGYSIEAVGGPAEDGSVAIDAVGRDPACRVRVTVRPLGGLTMVAVLYGAACPSG